MRCCSVFAPKNEKSSAGTPKPNTTFLSMFLKTNPSLKILFKKWTIAVKAIAISIGKNNPKAGNNIVPSPNPEKKVSAEANKATKGIIMYSIFEL